MPKKISETGLVATYGKPKVSWGKGTGLMPRKPTVVFPNVADGMHLTIVPDSQWSFNQMAFQATNEEFDEETNPLHTSIDDVTFDEFHVTEHGVGSAFFTIDGNLTLDDSTSAAPVGRAIGKAQFGWK